MSRSESAKQWDVYEALVPSNRNAVPVVNNFSLLSKNQTACQMCAAFASDGVWKDAPGDEPEDENVFVLHPVSEASGITFQSLLTTFSAERLMPPETRVERNCGHEMQQRFLERRVLRLRPNGNGLAVFVLESSNTDIGKGGARADPVCVSIAETVEVTIENQHGVLEQVQGTVNGVIFGLSDTKKGHFVSIVKGSDCWQFNDSGNSIPLTLTEVQEILVQGGIARKIFEPSCLTGRVVGPRMVSVELPPGRQRDACYEQFQATLSIFEKNVEKKECLCGFDEEKGQTYLLSLHFSKERAKSIAPALLCPLHEQDRSATGYVVAEGVVCHLDPHCNSCHGNVVVHLDINRLSDLSMCKKCKGSEPADNVPVPMDSTGDDAGSAFASASTVCTCAMDSDSKVSFVVSMCATQLTDTLANKLASALVCGECGEEGVWVLPSSNRVHFKKNCQYIAKSNASCILVDRAKLVNSDQTVLHPFHDCSRCSPKSDDQGAVSIISSQEEDSDEEGNPTVRGRRPGKGPGDSNRQRVSTRKSSGSSNKKPKGDSDSAGDQLFVEEQSIIIDNGGILIVTDSALILNAIAAVRNSVLTRSRKTKAESTSISFKRVFLPLELQATKDFLEVLKQILLQTLFKDTETKEEDLWPCLRDGEDLAENRTGRTGPHVLTEPQVLHYLL